MLARVSSFGLFGIEAYHVEIEVDVSRGLPAVNLVGLANPAIKESRVRVKSAIRNSGFEWPAEKIAICLAPSDVKKTGTAFDLAIALGILSASGQINSRSLQDCCFLGELSLDGTLRPVKGVLPISLALAASGIRQIVVARDNAPEAASVSGLSVWPMHSLQQAVGFLHDRQGFAPFRTDTAELFANNRNYPVDFSEIKGQFAAKRAIEIAVAGNHNLLLVGPPGSGKTMLAKRIPTVIPDLTLQEALEVTKIHSAGGALTCGQGIMATRPLRMPHHTVSYAGLVGGGSLPQPGEISLAHRGVLFLDELPEFRRDCLEALRQPLEEGCIRISRLGASLVFPARFMLVCAMNPCPCETLFQQTLACFLN